MFNVEEIKSRMRNGESIDDIANDLASALNTAEKEMDAEREAARAKAAELEKEAQLDALADVIVDSIANYIKIAAPDLEEYLLSHDSINGTDLRESIDGAIILMRMFAPMVTESKKENLERGKRAKAKMLDETVLDPDAIINAWLKTI